MELDHILGHVDILRTDSVVNDVHIVKGFDSIGKTVEGICAERFFKLAFLTTTSLIDQICQRLVKFFHHNKIQVLEEIGFHIVYNVVTFMMSHEHNFSTLRLRIAQVFTFDDLQCELLLVMLSSGCSKLTLILQVITKRVIVFWVFFFQELAIFETLIIQGLVL